MTTIHPARPLLAPCSPHTGGRPLKSCSPLAPHHYVGRARLDDQTTTTTTTPQGRPRGEHNQETTHDQTTTTNTTLVPTHLAPLAPTRPTTPSHPRSTPPRHHPTQPLPPVRSTTQSRLRHQERPDHQPPTPSPPQHLTDLLAALDLKAGRP